MPEPLGLLGHGQHGGAVEGGGAIGRFLGIELQLQVEEAAQAAIAAAAAPAEQVGHGGEAGQAAGQGGGAERLQQLGQIPAVAGR